MASVFCSSVQYNTRRPWLHIPGSQVALGCSYAWVSQCVEGVKHGAAPTSWDQWARGSGGHIAQDCAASHDQGGGDECGEDCN